MKLVATITFGLLFAGCDQAYAADFGAGPVVQQCITSLYLGVSDTASRGAFLYFAR